MMKMKLEYAQGFIDKGYAGHWRTISCQHDLLIIEDLESYQPSPNLGTRLIHGEMMTDSKGYVTFTRVKPIINKETRWTLS